MPKVGFHGHVEEAYLRHVEKKLKEKRAAMGINPLIRDIYVKVDSKEARSGAPLSPALSPFGLNVNDFVNNFNKQTEEGVYGTGVKIPTIINVFENKTLKFYITTIYSYYIASNNNNRYKLVNLKNFYKKFKIIKESKRVGTPRVWSVPHELYGKTDLSKIWLFSYSKRKRNLFKLKRLRRNKALTIVSREVKSLDDKFLYKNILATIQGNRIILYLRLKQFIKGNKFLPEMVSEFNHETFLNGHQKIFIGAYGQRYKRYLERYIKLKSKVSSTLSKWFIHKDFFFYLLYFKCQRRRTQLC